MLAREVEWSEEKRERGGLYWLWCEAIYKGRSKCLVYFFFDSFFFSLLRSALETKAMDTDKWPPQGCVRRVTVQSDNSATLVAEMIWLPDDDKQLLEMSWGKITTCHQNSIGLETRPAIQV